MLCREILHRIVVIPAHNDHRVIGIGIDRVHILGTGHRIIIILQLGPGTLQHDRHDLVVIDLQQLCRCPGLGCVIDGHFGVCLGNETHLNADLVELFIHQLVQHLF